MEKKKGKGCLKYVIIFVVLLGGAIFGIVQLANNVQKEQDADKANLVFDALSFFDGKDATVNEQKLIEKLGEPDSTEEWNYETGTKVFPIRTLVYDQYRYDFNSEMLQRIEIDGVDIPYTDKDKILALFGLKKYGYSVVTDTGVAYRVKNCGVHDFWIPIMDEQNLKSIRISYGTLFD
ncbi:hypothetical protein FACS1894217_05220 [Clostridia bacterium]|nr:hypothetical protein FACS1894217_05220 [Clostridia bacterium]